MVALWLVAMLAVVDPQTSTHPPSHIRPLTKAAGSVVDDAMRASPTITAMMASIEQTDVIVYVDVKFSQLSWRGGTRFIGASTTTRFVQVTINLTLPLDGRAEILAHELQHVLEIAGSPNVRDDAGMRQLFSTIGWGQGEEYETAAAIDVEGAVHREMWQRGSQPRPARVTSVRR